ncbi:MAG: alpha-glucosidase [Schleiferilactobacillus perolens]|uniref:glycoside hydrolase family 13 protein n=1 Tax=Schleiferilactobacillus perolens TaxID=100468 RepID=UPI0039E7C8F2
MSSIEWWQKATVYQIYPRSFQDSNGDGIGDLPGITQRLDYVKSLGVDVLWLNPIYESPNDDNGYDISNYRKIMPEFGTMDDFDKLLSGIHTRGMKLMMDLVVNHTSDEHPWFQQGIDPSSPYHNFYIWRKGEKDGTPPNNWRSEFHGPAWQFNTANEEWYLHLFSQKQPDLNWDNPAVRAEVYDIMKWWCEKGIDGFRMDVINLISKPTGLPDDPLVADGKSFSSLRMSANGPHVHEYLREMNRTVLSQYDLITVGETGDVTAEDAIKYTGFDRHELEMVFQFEHMNLDNDPQFGKWSTRKLNLVDLKRSLSYWQEKLHGRAWNSLYWNNHDQPRVVSRFGNDTPQYRSVSAKMLAQTLHFLQGTPYIYQGEELGMTNARSMTLADYKDLDTLNAYQELVEEKKLISSTEMMAAIQRRSRDNARTPMQWDATNNAGFSTVTPWLKVNGNYVDINVHDEETDPDSVLAYYKKLISVRQGHDVFIDGSYQLLDPTDDKVYAYVRENGSEKVLVINNFSDEFLKRDFASQIDKTVRLLISNYASDQGMDNLRPYEAKSYIVQKQ